MKTNTGPAAGGVYRYYVLVMLMLTFMFNIADRLVMSILIEDIKAEFVLSDTQIGLLAGTAFTFFYLILGIPAGLCYSPGSASGSARRAAGRPRRRSSPTISRRTNCRGRWAYLPPERCSGRCSAMSPAG